MSEAQDKPGAASPHGHDHARVGADNERRVRCALLITGGFMIAEALGGIFAGSLALLADAGHMLADTAALALSWYAFRISRRPATPARSYGHERIQVLAALINGGTLIAISAWIVVEAAERLFAPTQVLGVPMLIVAALGLGANVVSFLILRGGNRENLNIQSALLHVAGDLLGSLGAVVAALVIMFTDWTPIDPILSIFVTLLILRSAWKLIRRSWHVLMEGKPEALDLDALKRALIETTQGLRDIHHIHAWSLTPERAMLTLHATIADDAAHDDVLHRLQATLAERFGIEHATIQLERAARSSRHRRQRTASDGLVVSSLFSR